MKLGRVIGRVVSTQKLECLEGLKLLLVQPVDEAGADAGAPIVAFDTARAGEGDLVFFESGKEAAQANPNGWYNPADAAILGIVDAVNGEARPGAAQRAAGPAQRGERGSARGARS
jgi:ethanolamine utilization protein EutN